MPTRSLLAALFALTLAAHASAQKLSPGLWEYGFASKGGGGQMDASMAQMQQQMQQQLAAMPPERRKQMEQMMASRGVGMGAGGATTVRFCITPEQAARDDLPQKDAQCQQMSKQRSGNVLRVKFSCSGSPPSSGEAEYTLVSEKETKGHMTVNTEINGQPQRMEIDQTGRWVAADCGSLKPR
jgi:hypothetical protein